MEHHGCSPGTSARHGFAGQARREGLQRITGVTTLHGPVFATPEAGELPPYLDPIAYAVVAEVSFDATPDEPPYRGPPVKDIGSLRVVERSESSLLVEILIPPTEITEVLVGGERWSQVSTPGYGTG